MRQTILLIKDDHALHDVLMRGLRDEDFDVVSPLLTNACRCARSRIAFPPTAHPTARGSRPDGHGGVGLGLPSARRPARAAGGEVTYDPGHTPGGTVRDQPACRVTAPHSTPPERHGVMSRWMSLRETAR
ncbi:hypothetical protein [Streptomyces sp. WELS2]|uniref:hypothetical protein n=1 Tax=Streptomyces sp. WELS2 TaxID=2749435 RepID=UPI00215D7C48|nr:hypothetical protein [Streptomyces sp. WELS2]